jgi:hypothetical protein
MNTAQIATVTRIALSLWTSARLVERLPTVTVFEPTCYVQLAPTSNITARSGDYL